MHYRLDKLTKIKQTVASFK